MSLTTRILTVDPDHPQDGVLNETARLLNEGALVVVPTETVYGIASSAAGCKSCSADALYEVKRRPREVALPVMVNSDSALDLLGDVKSPALLTAHTLATAFWPGPLTLVIPANDRTKRDYFAAPQGTIGLRCPDSPFLLNLIDSTGPLYVTSANLHGRPAPTSATALDPELLVSVDLVVDGGETREKTPSTVVICTGDSAVPLLIVREGALTARELKEALDHK